MTDRRNLTVLRQLKAILNDPIPMVGVEALDENIFEWHCNFYFGPNHEFYPDLVLHFVMTFEENYPSSSPQVLLCHEIAHSHVHFPRICFSLLQDFRHFFESTNTPASAYWNPTRTARQFLIELYAFLTEDLDKHIELTPAVRQVVLSLSRQYCCGTCGHSYAEPKPPCELREEEAGKMGAEVETEVEAEAEEQYLARLAVPQLLEAATQALLSLRPRPSSAAGFLAEHFAGLAAQEAQEAQGGGVEGEGTEGGLCASTSVPAPAPAPAYDAALVEDLRCPVCQRDFFQPEAVVGFGVSSGRSGSCTDFSPLCSVCFTEGIRTSAAGQRIQSFLPFVVNEQHWGRAQALLSERLLEPFSLVEELCQVWKNAALEVSTLHIPHTT
jgi:ubiquitin-protein ligase